MSNHVSTSTVPSRRARGARPSVLARLVRRSLPVRLARLLVHGLPTSVSGSVWAGSLIAAALLLVLSTVPAHAERVRDLASIQGVRDNPLIGYGLIVGLDGTGDQTTQTPFTVQSLSSMLSQLGVTLPSGSGMQLKNVAAVMVTAALPSFVRPGQAIDITVSSLGNAKSLRGGTLLMTPLKGADGQVYAIAQGNLLIGGAGASANGSSVQINHLSVGRISGGAIVERAVPTNLAADGIVRLELNDTSFDNVMRITNAVNTRFGQGTASALDGRTVALRPPLDPNQQVAFLAGIEDVDVTPQIGNAKVVLNARTGSIVMNRMVTLQVCAVAHGNLSVIVNTTPSVSQPNALSSGGTTTTTQQSTIQVKQEPGALRVIGPGASLAEVVKGLNALGATPGDLMSILQAMKAAGALNADLEII
ncbi:flagellar basal body P-ring protein FlgI [Robbsia sp. Bb-Pol-6]|uniref:Flagellar P-ring protein n=1 Tax=Robbsia betulipollinis TaxID=2981849 RepID=A0ABT3ZHK6_9BURK|nr:flagellar basal body P-ring protein FlgI [Robbsia betulipollinis]MCY0386011.1 flagellar basal body P-ring protein FlgI [Robbsia betulipollinis]